MSGQILAVDVGGSHVKLLLSDGRSEPRRFASGPELRPQEMVDGVAALTGDWSYDSVSVGVPAPVHARSGRGRAGESRLAAGSASTSRPRSAKPTKIINDAAMQALGSYEGGKMLFLGLGTGLGSTLIVDGVIVPMELAHLPFQDGGRTRTMSVSVAASVSGRRSGVPRSRTRSKS